MTHEIRRAIYEKICPAEWLTAMRLAGSDVSNASALRARMCLYVRGGREQAKLKSVGATGITAMDIGNIGLGPDQATSAVSKSDAILAALQTMSGNLESLITGKGKGKSKGSDLGKGPGGLKGEKGKSKGKGKGKPSDIRPGTKVCHKFAETGRCPHMEQYGWCKFKHVRNVPKSLSGIEGLRLEDLGEVQYHPKEDEYTCPACDDKAIAASIREEVAQISAELGDIECFEFGPASGFAGH